MPVGPLLNEGTFVTEFSFFSIANFCQATAALGIPLSLHLCELARARSGVWKSCQIHFPSNPVKLRSGNFAIVRWSLETDVDELGL